ncbi:MAG TPA: hypothetical protein VFH46_23965 [Pyrinomonadaceae bacterium]|nr:hypothetical protein [Pyrinomonadaceae bacterium]
MARRSRSRLRTLALIILVLIVALVAFVAYRVFAHRGPRPGTLLDEARQANRPATSFTAADEDYFHDMDGAVPLTPAEVKGRNTWVVWTGGNDRFWDKIGTTSFGALDLLKTLSSYPNVIDPATGEKFKYSRDNRWYYLGLVNEPCFEKATGPDPNRFGLWLDKRVVSPECPPDPFENETKYPGVRVGWRGQQLPPGQSNQYLPQTMPVGSFYGYATGIVGLRLFPNPDFNAAAAQRWDPERYYSDPSYYYSRDLVRPYRVGMSCAFCHVGPDPVKPPADPEHPKWENLNNSVGAQYFWIDRIFDWRSDPSSYVFQMFHTSRPGTLDTSLVSSDNINNPRTMNAIYNLGPRLEQAKRFGKETLGPGSIDNKQLNDYVPPDNPLAQFFVAPSTVYSPRVLKDGSDSVGALGALNRVYLNIGLFSEEWLLHFNPLVGGKTVSPIEIAVARKNSSYWEATEAQTVDMALFFLKAAMPHKLSATPDGKKYLNNGNPDDAAYVARVNNGKTVFAETCARCHSSKLPTPDAPKKIFATQGCSGPDYLNCWNEYWQWTKTEEFKSKMRNIVMAPDFLDGNYLSAEHRVPVTLLQTNACSPLATNAIRDNIWDNFSSDTYKDLPSVGTIKVNHPITGEERTYEMPGGGRGYTRPASLISLWSTAPFLLNNSVGPFNPSPSVDARMQSFQASIEQMLLLRERDKDPVLAAKGLDIGVIDRTTTRCSIRVAPGYVPNLVEGFGDLLFPSIFEDDGGVNLGPIPPGTPVGLLASLNLRPEGLGFWQRVQYDWRLLGLVKEIKHKLNSLDSKATDEQVQQAFAPLADSLMSLSKCPDYVVNRGHYFGTGRYGDDSPLTEQQKRDLIEFLKTF